MPYKVLATAGVAATNLTGCNAQTLHSWFCIRPDHGDSNRISLLTSMFNSEQKPRQLRRVKFYVIDEVSMLHSDYLDALNRWLQSPRASPRRGVGVPLKIIRSFAPCACRLAPPPQPHPGAVTTSMLTE